MTRFELLSSLFALLVTLRKTTLHSLQIYTGNKKTIVKINNDISEPLKIEKGVRQGCVLSPALFNLYTDIIFRNIDQGLGIKLGGHTINNLRYADDTVLLAENETELQQILDTVKTKSERYGLFMNVKKNKKIGILQE